MGNIEHINELESYIEDLGNEIKNVKKASDYLKLIEQHQSEIEKSVNTLTQSKDLLKDYREVIENKLELFQTTSRNIEVKQQMLEQLLVNISSSIKELKEHQEKAKIESNTAFNEVKSKVNEKQLETVAKLKDFKEEQELKLIGISKVNIAFFIVNMVLSISILGILIFILMK